VKQEPVLYVKFAPWFAMKTMGKSIFKISIVDILIFYSLQAKDFKI
jgi:hypothetical protein